MGTEHVGKRHVTTSRHVTHDGPRRLRAGQIPRGGSRGQGPCRPVFTPPPPTFCRRCKFSHFCMSILQSFCRTPKTIRGQRSSVERGTSIPVELEAESRFLTSPQRIITSIFVSQGPWVQVALHINEGGSPDCQSCAVLVLRARSCQQQR